VEKTAGDIKKPLKNVTWRAGYFIYLFIDNNFTLLLL